MTNDRPPGLYIHVPFCATRCPYCDFYSMACPGTERRRRMEDFAAGVVSEAAARLGRGGRQGSAYGAFDTVYLGGGTPSLLEPESLARILEGLRGEVETGPEAETTIEANPDDVDARKAASWKAAGVDRVSLGVQSLDDGALRLLGRRHDAACSRSAYRALRDAGFDRIGIDLIYGVPGQGPGEWRKVLDEAVEMRPEHISCYILTFVEDTPLGRAAADGRLVPETDERLGSLFLETSAVLAGAGYEHYEVSNFSLGAVNRSRHNSKYWDRTPYAGLGPSAHSFDGRRRSWNHPDLDEWAAAVGAGGDPAAGCEVLTPEQESMEEIYFGLRTSAGADLDAVLSTAGGREVLESLVDDGFLRVEGERVVPTLRGYLFSDYLPSMFF